MYMVMQWSEAQHLWFEIEQCTTRKIGITAFAYWLRQYGSENEYRLAKYVGLGQPTVICANSKRGFEVGE